MPLSGQLFTAQRFAIDWEQLADQGGIYVGNPRDSASYIIYGQLVYAVADACVLMAVDGLPDTLPGVLPVGSRSSRPMATMPLMVVVGILSGGLAQAADPDFSNVTTILRGHPGKQAGPFAMAWPTLTSTTWRGMSSTGNFLTLMIQG